MVSQGKMSMLPYAMAIVATVMGFASTAPEPVRSEPNRSLSKYYLHFFGPSTLIVKLLWRPRA
jgi:hypothetical protein